MSGASRPCCVATRLRRCCTDSHRPAVLWSNYPATLACVADTILTPQCQGVQQLTYRNQRDSRLTLRSCSEKQKSKLALKRQACSKLQAPFILRDPRSSML